MIRVISDTRVPIKIWADDLEPEAEQQVRSLASLPFVYKHLAVQADAHAGKGSTVGTVVATSGAIIPSCVGLDVGCGMCALKLPFKIDEFKDLSILRHSIERAIPTGKFGNKVLTDNATISFQSLGNISQTAQDNMRNGVYEKSSLALGTLGGGNHFIELCYDQGNNAWIMLHSGSRNIGKCLAEIHINKAKDLMKQYFISLPDPDLAYLVKGTCEFQEYIHDLNWGQKFAFANREEMMRRTLEQVYRHLYKDNWYEAQRNQYDNWFKINCHHNYTQLENHFGKNVYVTRKGAVSARENEWGIIPGSMGTGSHIVRGLGNLESFCSCSHGAGRKMSRTKARAMFTKEDLANQTLGIECRKDDSIVDEIPSSYKDIKTVMENQKDLVQSVYSLKQVLVIKGD